MGATEEDQGSPRAGPPGRGRDGRPRRAAGEPRARRASRAAGTEAGRGPVRSGCPRRSAPAALRAGDFRAGRGAQGAPGAGLGERARVPGVPLPCPAQPARSPNPESVTHWPGAAQGHEVKGACSSFKELAGRSGRQMNGQAAARRGPCVGARRDCSGVTARGRLGPPVSGAWLPFVPSRLYMDDDHGRRNYLSSSPILSHLLVT